MLSVFDFPQFCKAIIVTSVYCTRIIKVSVTNNAWHYTRGRTLSIRPRSQAAPHIESWSTGCLQMYQKKNEIGQEVLFDILPKAFGILIWNLVQSCFSTYGSTGCFFKDTLSFTFSCFLFVMPLTLIFFSEALLSETFCLCTLLIQFFELELIAIVLFIAIKIRKSP